MFERFTQDARAAVVVAQELARQADDDHIGSAHVLAGAVGSGDTLAGRALAWLGVEPEALRRAAAAQERGRLDADALAGLGIDLDEVRAAVERTFGAGALDVPARGARRRGHLPFDAAGKKLLQIALREAIAGGERSIDTGHLLLAAVRLHETPAHRTLLALGLDLAEVRQTALAQRGRDEDGGSRVAV